MRRPRDKNGVGRAIKNPDGGEPSGRGEQKVQSVMGV